MIRFINSRGELFDGSYPYVHWAEGQQSTDLWYTIKLLIISDSPILNVSSFKEESIFRFVNSRRDYNKDYNSDFGPAPINQLTGSTYNEIMEAETFDQYDVFDLKKILSTSYEYVPATPYKYKGNDFYIHQILIVCSSDVPGQFTDQFSISVRETGCDYDDDYNNDFGPMKDKKPIIDEKYTITVGADFYDEDEILSINLGNRGLELPKSIQKSFLCNRIEEDKIDNILINRKFKELISNYLDIMDNKGSYKSLYNSLKWFEWGDSLKLYEIWKCDDDLFEKELTNILSETYSSLLYTHKKTTHLSLVSALQKITNSLDIEKNPEIENIDYHLSQEELMLKISILGAFFERYFMPIYLDLKRASMESLVFTNSIKATNGNIYRNYNYFNDTGIVDIQMEHIFTLGNLDTVAVSPYTVFGKLWDIYSGVPVYTKRDFDASFNLAFGPPQIIEIRTYKTSNVDDEDQEVAYWLTPIGVTRMEDIDILTNHAEYTEADGELGTFFSQIVGGVGSIIPIHVSVPMEEEDALCCETITIYRNDESPQQIQERKLWKSTPDYDKNGNIVGYSAKFDFNLLSIREELVKFTLTLHSVSGHTWTAASSYQCVDTSGSYLNICRIKNTNNIGPSAVFTSVDEWLNGNPYGTQYNTIDSNNIPQMITQYVPTIDPNQFNLLVLVDNGENYDTSWVTGQILDNFWAIYRGPVEDDVHKYITLISKEGGYDISKNEFCDLYGINKNRIKRFEQVYIPQLHTYTPIESTQLDKTSMINSGYVFTQNDLLCVIPQFKYSTYVKPDPDTIRWEFINESTREVIKYDIPLSTPLIAQNKYDLLSPGYWTVNMYYRFMDSNEDHKLTKKSAFKIV